MTKTQQRERLGCVETVTAVTRRSLRTDAHILKARGLTLAGIADRLGVSITTVWKWTQ